jgi:hypothetical protein
MLTNLVIRERGWMSAFGISIEGLLMAGSERTKIRRKLTSREGAGQGMT